MSNPPTTRPYTSYNLFFQLEREYILQTLLGFQPTIASKDIFNPADKTYPAEGPPLPSRYENLVLPYDWHIPGKTRPHERSHHKSNDKNELNEEISEAYRTAWSTADYEMRNFCARLSDIESRNYKKDRRKTTDKENVTRMEHADTSRASSHRGPFTEVDMEDDEIIDIWKTTPI